MQGWEWAEGLALEGEDSPGGRSSTCQVGRSRRLEGMERGKWDGHMENGAVWMGRGCEQGQARLGHTTWDHAGLNEGFPLTS